MLTIFTKVLWRSYKIEGKWYEGTIIDIQQRKRLKVFIIQTDLHGIHSRVERIEADIKKIKPER